MQSLASALYYNPICLPISQVKVNDVEKNALLMMWCSDLTNKMIIYTFEKRTTRND